MSDIIQIRRDTLALWMSVNPTLASGEIGYESDTANFKVGDGILDWNSLPYMAVLGAQGMTGLQGMPGYQGDQGETGIQGQTGIHGFSGIQGTQGNTGVQGQTGVQGVTGIQGITGIGTQGTTGPSNFDVPTIDASFNRVSQPFQVVSALSSTTIDWANGNQVNLAMDNSITTLTLSNPRDGEHYLVKTTQDAGVGGKTITWPVGIKWKGGSPPTLTASVNAKDAITLVYDGTEYIADASLNFF